MSVKDDPRMSKGYVPQFDIDLKVGREGETTALDYLDGLGSGRIEVKRDDKAAVTGNIFIEYECKGQPSGIEVSTADAWCFVIGKKLAFFVPTDALKHLYKLLKKSSKHKREMNRGARPTKGVIIPISDLMGLSLDALQAVEEKKKK